jgi:hypothetical protein
MTTKILGANLQANSLKFEQQISRLQASILKGQASNFQGFKATTFNTSTQVRN